MSVYIRWENRDLSLNESDDFRSSSAENRLTIYSTYSLYLTKINVIYLTLFYYNHNDLLSLEQAQPVYRQYPTERF